MKPMEPTMGKRPGRRWLMEKRAKWWWDDWQQMCAMPKNDITLLCFLLYFRTLCIGWLVNSLNIFLFFFWLFFFHFSPIFPVGRRCCESFRFERVHHQLNTISRNGKHYVDFYWLPWEKNRILCAVLLLFSSVRVQFSVFAPSWFIWFSRCWPTLPNMPNTKK